MKKLLFYVKYHTFLCSFVSTVESRFKQLVLLIMYPTCMLTITTSSREQMPRSLPNPMTKPSLGSWLDFVLVATQLELIRSSGVLVSMCALTQHSYAMSGSNPLTWTLVVLALMLDTFTSWICPSDSADVVHDKSYPLMILSLGIDCLNQLGRRFFVVIENCLLLVRYMLLHATGHQYTPPHSFYTYDHQFCCWLWIPNLCTLYIIAMCTRSMIYYTMLHNYHYYTETGYYNTCYWKFYS